MLNDHVGRCPEVASFTAHCSRIVGIVLRSEVGSLAVEAVFVYREDDSYATGGGAGGECFAVGACCRVSVTYYFCILCFHLLFGEIFFWKRLSAGRDWHADGEAMGDMLVMTARCRCSGDMVVLLESGVA